jgi:homoserine kinase
VTVKKIGLTIVLALATSNFESIADRILDEFSAEGIKCEWKLLEPAQDGTTVTRSSDTTKGMTYADAGVSIDAGNTLVQRIKAAVASTARPGADAEIGGFGGAIDLKAAGYDETPVIVQAIDGVGTKLKIAFATGKHDTVGIDLVAMNVNDLVVQGAEPLSFLDYYACSKLNVDVCASFVEGVAKGCKEAGCALVGGETAEMPGMYEADEYDAGGAATGAIKRGAKILPDKQSMIQGDVLLGLASNGLHSNGFSLVRRILEARNVSYAESAPWDANSTVGDSLLIPTRIYVNSCLALVKANLAKGMAHITGGGLTENIPRMLPKNLAAEVNVGKWPVPPVQTWLKKAGGVTSMEFARTWNTGIGMVIVVSSEDTDKAIDILQKAGETVYNVGKLVNRTSEGCTLTNIEIWE